MTKNLLIEKYLPSVRLEGAINTALPIKTTSTLTVGGAATVTGALSVTGAITAGGAISQSGVVPTVFHSGGVVEAGALTTNYHQTQLITTDTFVCEVFVPANTTLTGISILNGHTTNGSVNLSVGLANGSGTIVAHSATTVAQSTADAYQQIPFTSTYVATGPAKYYICIQGSTTTGYLATHHVGNYGAVAVTSETYGTFLTTASYSTTTFTADVGPIASTY